LLLAVGLVMVLGGWKNFEVVFLNFKGAVAFAVETAGVSGVGSDLPGLRAGGPISGWNDDT